MARDRLLLRLLCAAALTTASAACSPTPDLSSSIQPAPEEALRLTGLTDLDQRVARVAWRLSEANTDLCPTVRMAAGWALHSARQYSPALRPHAEARFGLRGDLPGVLAAPPGSPAASAGFRTGDLLVAVGAASLAAGETGRAAAWEGLEANIRTIDAALAHGPTAFTVQRNGEILELTVQPLRACGYEVQLNPSNDLKAHANGGRLFISTGLAGFARTDDELAVILGHELAHHVLGHNAWNEADGAGRRPNDDVLEVEGGSGDAERQADRVGLYLSARAGYDPAAAPPFFRRLAVSDWRFRYPQIGHASAGARADALEAVQREIEARRRGGGELLP